MAKRIRVSEDAGTTWMTLPGNSGELSSEAGEIDDTIFGQNFESVQPGLIGWTVSANALYKGFAGYVATLKRAGTSTAMTGEAMTQVGATQTWRVTAAAKNVWDRSAAFVVKAGGTPVAANNIESIDYLFGRVTFVSGYTPGGAVTVDGAYLPLQTVGCSNGFTLTQTANAIDETCMDTAKLNDGFRVFDYGLKTVSLELEGIYRSANDFLTLLTARQELIIELSPDGGGLVTARGFFRASATGQSGDVGDLEQENITFNLSVPDDDLIPYPFHWEISSGATLNAAVVACLNAWEQSTPMEVAYLPDGATGFEGTAIITDLSLTGGLEVMNEFTVNFQGSGKPVPHP